MAWIEIIDEPKPGRDLHRIYKDQCTQAGAVVNILKVHSIPAHMRTYLGTRHLRGTHQQPNAFHAAWRCEILPARS